MRLLRSILAACLLLQCAPARADDAPLPFKRMNIGHGVTLNYLEAGAGPALVFVHGSLSDAGYWKAQIAPFAAHYHVIAYSRRYNWPNANAPIAGYSAVTDAEDLAALIGALHLSKAYVIGHSYGALTTLFLAARHPDLVQAAILAEPPAVSLLQHIEGEDAERGLHAFADIQARMVSPMQVQFRAGKAEEGVATFFDYIFADPNAWTRQSAVDRAETMKDAGEWKIMLPNGTLFPEIAPEEVRRITTPVLLMSGARSYPFLGLIDEILLRLIPHAERIVFADAGHQMWLMHPDEARGYAEAFFAAHPP